MAILKLILAGFLALGQILEPVGAWLVNMGEDAFFTDWSEADVFGKDDYIELKKTPGEEFVVLNLADVQLEDHEQYGDLGAYAEDVIRKLVNDYDPDLITLSGDNAWGTMSYIELIKLVDSFGIPWAPVMGNHDGQGCISEFWVAYLLYEAENCLFEFGPKDMGYGNYIINVTENGRIVHTFFMMDTHNNRDYELEDGTVVSAYDHLWENQMAWYKWAVEGIADLAGHTVESTVIMHIPVVEYFDAWGQYTGDPRYHGEIKDEWYPIAYGGKYEIGGFAFHEDSEGNITLLNNGFFDLAKNLGSTKNIVVGHDHVNDFSVLYEGIRLTYAVKTGLGCYYRDDMIGGTTIYVNSLGNARIQQNYYDVEENGWIVEEE